MAEDNILQARRRTACPPRPPAPHRPACFVLPCAAASPGPELPAQGRPPLARPPHPQPTSRASPLGFPAMLRCSSAGVKLLFSVMPHAARRSGKWESTFGATEVQAGMRSQGRIALAAPSSCTQWHRVTTTQQLREGCVLSIKLIIIWFQEAWHLRAKEKINTLKLGHVHVHGNARSNWCMAMHAQTRT